MDSETKPYKSFLFDIAGVQHSQYRSALEAGLAEEHELTLVLEPENQYDPKAVAIYYLGCKLGYVPKKCPDLQQILHERGEPLNGVKCILIHLSPDEPTWRMFSCVCEIAELEV